jgi:hypothetical protein
MPTLDNGTPVAHKLNAEPFTPRLFIRNTVVAKKRLLVLDGADNAFNGVRPIQFITRLYQIVGWTDWSNDSDYQFNVWTELVFAFEQSQGMGSFAGSVPRQAADGLRFIGGGLGKHVQLSFYNQQPGHSDDQLQGLRLVPPIPQVDARFVFHDRTRSVSPSQELGEFLKERYGLGFLVNAVPASPAHAFERGIVFSKTPTPYFDEVVVVTVDDKGSMTARGYELKDVYGA